MKYRSHTHTKKGRKCYSMRAVSMDTVHKPKGELMKPEGREDICNIISSLWSVLERVRLIHRKKSQSKG